MSNGSVNFSDYYDTMDAEKAKGVHLFERAGMGKAPFRVTGYGELTYQACPGAPIQPGGSCNYCGTGIRYCANIESSDGQKHVVGLDCVRKTGDGGLLRGITRSPEYRAAQRAKRHAKDLSNIAAFPALLAQVEALGTAEGISFDRRWKWCGASGRARILKEMRDALSREGSR